MEDVMLACLKVAKTAVALARALAALAKVLHLRPALVYVARVLATATRVVEKETRPKRHGSSPKPTLGRVMHGFSHTVVLYLIALGISGPGVLYILWGQALLPGSPLKGFALLVISLLCAPMAGRYWRSAHYRRQALCREWVIYRRSASVVSYAKLWMLTIALPAIAYLNGLAPQLFGVR